MNTLRYTAIVVVNIQNLTYNMWILPKNHPLYSVYAQDFSLDLTEDLKQHWEETPEPLLMWKSKLLSWPTLLRAWKRVYWMRYLCGRILKPSLGPSFEEKWIGSLEDTHASRLAMLENGGGAEDPRHLWPYIAEGIRTIRPVGCFFENVSGHLTLGYETVRGELQDMGYRVEEGIFTAEEVGAPHRRERLFILALLGDPKSDNQWNDSFWSRYRQESVRRTGVGQANTNSYGYQKRNGLRRIKNNPTESKETGGKWKRLRIESTPRSKIMANTNECRSSQDFKFSERYSSVGNRQPSTITNWPAGPGEQQYDWEEARTVESGMGCTVNGYNFREDILRGEGNGVVWQTAELAFRTLLKKHEQKYI